MAYIEDNTEVAVSKAFKKSYLKAKAEKIEAKERFNSIKDKPEEGGLFRKIRKARAKKKFDKAKTNAYAKEFTFVLFEDELRKLKKEAKQTPILHEAKIKYPSIGDPVSTDLEKKKRRRKLALIVGATLLLSATAIILTGGFAIPGMAAAAVLAPLISGLALPAPAITGMAVGAIVGIGLAVSYRTFRGLRKYEKTEKRVKAEKVAIVKAKTNEKANAKRRRKRKQFEDMMTHTYREKNSKNIRKSVDPPGRSINEIINVDFENSFYKARNEIHQKRMKKENSEETFDFQAFEPFDFFAENSSQTTKKVKNLRQEDIILPGFYTSEQNIPVNPPAYNPNYKKPTEDKNTSANKSTSLLYPPENNGEITYTSVKPTAPVFTDFTEEDNEKIFTSNDKSKTAPVPQAYSNEVNIPRNTEEIKFTPDEYTGTKQFEPVIPNFSTTKKKDSDKKIKKETPDIPSCLDVSKDNIDNQSLSSSYSELSINSTSDENTRQDIADKFKISENTIYQEQKATRLKTVDDTLDGTKKASDVLNSLAELKPTTRPKEKVTRIPKSVSFERLKIITGKSKVSPNDDLESPKKCRNKKKGGSVKSI